MYLVTVLVLARMNTFARFASFKARRADRIDTITPMRLRGCTALSVPASLTEAERVQEATT